MRVKQALVVRAQQGAVLGLLAVTAGALLGGIAPLAPFEPGFVYRDAAPAAGADARLSCVRGHWDQPLLQGGPWWHYVAALRLGDPSQAARLLLRLDVPAATGLAEALGVALVDAEAVIAAAHAHQATLAPAHSPGFLAVVSSDRLVSSVASPYRTPSATLADCTQPLAHVPAVVCTERVRLVARNPNRAPSVQLTTRSLAVVLVGAAGVGTVASLNGLDGELFLDDGSEEATAAVGLTTLCTTAAGSAAADGGAPLVALRGDAGTTLSATLDAATGLRAALAPTARCGADGSEAALYPIASAHPRTLLGHAGLGVGDAEAYDAAACGNASVGTAASATAVGALTCGVQPRACDASAAPTLPMADVARRALLLERNGTRVDVTLGEGSDAVYGGLDELALALLRFGALVVVSLAADARSKCGVSGAELLTETLRAASDLDEMEVKPCSSGRLVSVLMLVLRVAQIGWLAAQLVANHASVVLGFEATSCALSGVLLLLQLAVVGEPEVRRTLFGGSSWLLDAMSALLLLSAHLPFGEERQARGFLVVARAAVGAVLITQVLPRLAVNAGATLSAAASERYTAGFRTLSAVASVLQSAQGFLVGALVASVLLRTLASLSAASNGNFAVTMAIIAMVLVATVALQTAKIFWRMFDAVERY